MIGRKKNVRSSYSSRMKMCSKKWGHRAPSMPSLAESSPTAVSLCQKPREDLTAWKTCNFPFFLRNPAPFTGEEVRRGGAVSASVLGLRFLHLQPALWQQHFSFALSHSFFSSSQVQYGRWQKAGLWVGLRKPHLHGESTWKRTDLGSGRTQRHVSVCQHWHSCCREELMTE